MITGKDIFFFCVQVLMLIILIVMSIKLDAVLNFIGMVR